MILKISFYILKNILTRDYEDEFLITAKLIDSSLVLQTNKRYKYNIWAKCEYMLMLQQLVHSATAVFKTSNICRNVRFY
jgi:hypothetical protein